MLGTSVYLLHPEQVAGNIPPPASYCFDQVRAGFAIQTQTAHTLTTDPDSASVILAPIRIDGYGSCFEALRTSSIYKGYAEKLLVYSPEDNQFPAVRGLYPSISRRWIEKGWALPAHYISTHIHQFHFDDEEIKQKDILFSFVGSSRTHELRETIVRWRDPTGIVVDSSARTDRQTWWEKADKDKMVELYRDVTRRSKFVLCPRGVSASSIRVFEAMEAGAIPVILADDLELPVGPQWDGFCLRVPEAKIDMVPRMVERWQDRAPEMGLAARRAWKEFFSPEATVGSMVGWALDLLARPHQRPIAVRAEEYLSPRRIKVKLGRAFGGRMTCSSAPYRVPIVGFDF